MNHQDDDTPPSPEELEAAARLAASLERDAISTERDATAEQIRAAAGNAAPLGELRARGLTREAFQRAPKRRGRLWPAMLALAAAALILLAWGLRSEPLPDRLQARSAGELVPGPFPPNQSAAERLDLVTSDRLIAFREARCRSLRGGQ